MLMAVTRLLLIMDIHFQDILVHMINVCCVSDTNKDFQAFLPVHLTVKNRIPSARSDLLRHVPEYSFSGRLHLRPPKWDTTTQPACGPF